MTTASRSMAEMLAALGLETRVDPAGVWVGIPCERRGTLAVQIISAERTVTFRAFVMRAPDVGHEDVYRRLLRKNHEAALWVFSLDPLGDVFLVTTRPASTVDADALDGILGALSALVDEIFEGIVRTGFAIPSDVPLRPSPGELHQG